MILTRQKTSQYSQCVPAAERTLSPELQIYIPLVFYCFWVLKTVDSDVWSETQNLCEDLQRCVEICASLIHHVCRSFPNASSSCSRFLLTTVPKCRVFVRER